MVFSFAGKSKLEGVELSLAVKYFAIAAVDLSGKSEVSTQRFDGLCTSSNSLESRFELCA